MVDIVGTNISENLHGTNSNDRIWGESGDDQLVGNSGDDQLLGGYGDDSLWGGDNDDSLWGESGDDQLFGNHGSDQLVGGYGDDFLDGFGGGYSQEIDILTGGSGYDTFVIGRSDGVAYLGGGSNGTDYSYAQIMDFSAEYDYIQAHGSSSSYRLGYDNWVGNSEQDTGIYSGDDLLAVVQDTIDVSFTRDFIFV